MKREQRGFTLVELLIAMAIAGILISLIFAVYTKMSVAYQSQNRITSVVQNLRAAQSRLVRELQMVGNQFPQADYRPLESGAAPDHFAPNHLVPATANMHVGSVDYNGVKVAPTIAVPGQTAGTPLQPIYITNGVGTEPDEVRFFYADQGIRAKVETIAIGPPTTVTVVDHNTSDSFVPGAQFAQGDLVIVVNSTQEPILMDVTGDSVVDTFEVTAYEACLLQVTAVAVNTLTFAATSPFNAQIVGPPTSHCQDVVDLHNADIARPAAARADTMIYRLVGRAYRIDSGRRNVGVLQVQMDGGLGGGGWTDLGIGFTNMQIASRWYERGNTVNQDGIVTGDAIADNEYDWYSGENQEFPDATAAPDTRPNFAVMVEMSLSLESRSFANVDTPTGQILGYGDGSNINNNSIGDSPPIDLTTTQTDPRYDGDFIYRWTTVNFEFRNIGRWR